MQPCTDMLLSLTCTLLFLLLLSVAHLQPDDKKNGNANQGIEMREAKKSSYSNDDTALLYISVSSM